MASSAATMNSPHAERDHTVPVYRALSRSAAVAAILSVIGLLSWVSPIFLVVPLFALLFALIAYRSIRRYPDELAGLPMAVAALIVAFPTLLGASVYHWLHPPFVVPQGYRAVDFNEIRANSSSTELGLPFPPEVAKLDGKKIFITGYVHPGVQSLEDIKTFVLVPDMKTCCFGGQPKLTDMVEVTIVSDQAIQYSYRRRGVGGIFRVRPNPHAGPGGIKVGYYALEADHVQ